MSAAYDLDAETSAPPGYAWLDQVEPEVDEESLIVGLVPRRSYAPMNGRRGSGKTFVAIDMACRGSLGLPFMGRETERFGTIYCVGEKRARFAKRLEAWRSANPGHPAPPVCFRWGVPNLLDGESVSAFIAEVEGLQDDFARRGAPLGLVIFDTLARALHHANVSDADAAGTGIEAINRIIQACSVTVMPLAHVAKAEGSLSIKGAGEWEDAADAVLRIDRKEESPVRSLTVAKQSDEADGAELGFELEIIDLGITALGRPRTSCVVRPTDLEALQKPAKRLRGPTLIAAEALQFLVDQDVTHACPPFPGIPSHWKAVRMQDWRDRAFTAGLAVEGDTEGNKRTKWSRAIAGVKEARFVRIEGEWAIPLHALQGVSA